MSEQIQYEVSLKDLASAPLEKMEHHANKLEHSLHNVNHTALHMMEGLGMSFALFKGFDFVEEGLHKFHELHAAEAQVEAGLESTRHAAGLTFEELDKMADELSEHLIPSKGQIMDMQSILLTFPAVTKETFGDASMAVLDMATRLKTDASHAALQLGKALQDPIGGLAALHKAGVNTDELKKKFEHVTNTLDRQKLIIKELGVEFAGSAEAAAKADPLFKLHKLMEHLQETIGNVATKLLQKLTPAFEAISNAVRGAIKWMEEHKDLMEFLGTVLLAVTTAIFGIAAATQIWAAAQWLINVAMLNNPIGLVITGIAVLIGVVTYCWNHFKMFRQIVLAVWETLKAYIEFVVMGPIRVLRALGTVLEGVVTLNPAKIKQGFNDAKAAVVDGVKGIAEAWQSGWKAGGDSWNKSMADRIKDMEDQKKKHKDEGKGAGEGLGEGKPIGSKASGSKVTTINIKIGSLIGSQSFHVTNIQESIHKIREQVTQTLLSAVNDAQIVSGI